MREHAYYFEKDIKSHFSYTSLCVYVHLIIFIKWMYSFNKSSSLIVKQKRRIKKRQIEKIHLIEMNKRVLKNLLFYFKINSAKMVNILLKYFEWVYWMMMTVLYCMFMHLDGNIVVSVVVWFADFFILNWSFITRDI